MGNDWYVPWYRWPSPTVWRFRRQRRTWVVLTACRKLPRLLGVLSRGDVLSCYRRNLEEYQPEAPTIAFPKLRGKRRSSTASRSKEKDKSRAQ